MVKVVFPVQNYFFRLSNDYINSFLDRFTSYDFDFLLVDELKQPSFDWLNRRLLQPTQYPVISLVHQLRTSEPFPKEIKWIYRSVEKKYIQSVDGFIFNSQTTKRAVEAVAGKKLKGVVAFPSGDRFDHDLNIHQIVQRAHTSPINLVFVGNIIPRKGLLTLVKALSRIGDQNWQLNIIGNMRLDPLYTQTIIETIEHHALSDKVKFFGKVPDETLRRIYNQSHILIVPSTYEGFGIVYLEAMGFGVVPIGTTSGGAREIILSDQDGVLVAVDDEEKLAEKLSQLLTDRYKLAAMSAAAFHKYHKYPTWDETCLTIRNFLLTY